MSNGVRAAGRCAKCKGAFMVVVSHPISGVPECAKAAAPVATGNRDRGPGFYTMEAPLQIAQHLHGVK